MKSIFGKFIFAIAVIAGSAFAANSAFADSNISLSVGQVNTNSPAVYRTDLGVSLDVSSNFFVDGTARAFKSGNTPLNQYTDEFEAGVGFKTKLSAFTPYARVFYVGVTNLYGFEVGSTVSLTDRWSLLASGKRYLGQGATGNYITNRDEGRLGANYEVLSNLTVGADYLYTATPGTKQNGNGFEVKLAVGF